jgi:dTDP-4-amino-4,6-dideoxygalactose transaminase
MSAMLLNIQPGDEVIMPSYTFVSTANAFVLRGAVPVFVDIRQDTLNLDERLIEQAITSKTKAIVPVHYAGVSCEMDIINEIALHYGLAVVEDAAQGVMSNYRGRPLGSIGNFGAFSFHETKNIISGEGGALLVNDERYIQAAEIIREKGTDRSQFFRGQVDKYTWQVPGSSYLPGETTAAFLSAQLDEAESITERRLEIWNFYHSLFEDLERQELVRRPIIPDDCEHNAHMYYLLFRKSLNRDRILSELRSSGINCVFHYVPLHSSPGGLKYGRVAGSMRVTDCQSESLIRLPLWVGLTLEQQLYVATTIRCLCE